MPTQLVEESAAVQGREGSGTSAPEQVDSLERRLQALERRLADMDDDTARILAQHGSTWISNLQDSQQALFTKEPDEKAQPSQTYIQ
jgi:hypothetical protein